jgi:hypothetical protein
MSLADCGRRVLGPGQYRDRQIVSKQTPKIERWTFLERRGSHDDLAINFDMVRVASCDSASLREIPSTNSAVGGSAAA